MQKLIEIQSQLKAPKNQKNKFGNYNYRSCEDILEALKPLLEKANLLLTLSDELIEHNGINVIKAIATIKDIDSNEAVSTYAYAGIDLNKKGMDIAQTFGASSSYARKYALNALFLIDDSKDADSQDNTDKTPKESVNSKPWINPSDDKWKSAVEKKTDLSTVLQYFQMSKKNQEFYKTLLQKHIDEEIGFDATESDIY